MNINLVLINVYDFSLQSLVYGVLDIDSLTKIEPSFAKVKTWRVLQVFGEIRQSLEIRNHVILKPVESLKVLPYHFKGH